MPYRYHCYCSFETATTAANLAALGPAFAHLGVLPRAFLPPAWNPPCRSSASKLSTTGRANASVLPLPVFALPIKSTPSSAGCNAMSWIGNSALIPRFLSA
eukprot:GHUV01039448.1.p5 GENE.GHUV01039448.1~~GHUV01039448.1.p5  ORF type:complete len:101 (+),score=3.92 GHUV01039448.1:45-347(+)